LGFPEEQWTDRSERVMAAELIREQIFRTLGQELPYVSAVEIEHFERTPRMLRLGAVVWVERAGQKAIVIGKGGEQLKEIGRRARLEMESLFEGKVFLELWVKVREDWTDNAIALRSLGILEED
jgi:GTP-binding protein Era